MTRRQRTSSGQAIVMVTLSLFAMCGLIGMAVDLGLEFFVKQSAQAAVDAAAMAAVQEALADSGGAFSAPCGKTGVDSLVITCHAPADCSSVSTSTNLWTGCLYAKANGFDWTKNTRQHVFIQAGGKNGGVALPTTASGGTLNLSATAISYWVTVSAVQTVPQLFSAMLGNRLGTVSAISTAAITAVGAPGDLITLGQPNDCSTVPMAGFFSLTTSHDCGVDINLGSGLSFFDSISSNGPILMASTCDGVSSGSGNCRTGGSADAHAGQDGGGFFGFGTGSVTGSSIQVAQGGGVTDPGDWHPSVTQSSNSSLFNDPTQGEPQPPLTASAPIATCGILNGVVSQQGAQPITLGPYNYYAYHMVSGHAVATGDPITLNGNVNFSSAGTCTSGANGGAGAIFNQTGASSQSTAFPTTIFYGGLQINPNSIGFGTTNFAKGQYVMVGTSTTADYLNGGTPDCSGSVFCVGGVFAPNITGDSTAGTMFIFTSPQGNYPGVNTQINNFPELSTAAAQANKEGSVDFLGVVAGSINLTGVVLGQTGFPQLDQYNAVAMWQDRANSTVTYDATGHVTSTSCPPAGCPQPTANGINMFGLAFNSMHINGAIYQPRGSYFSNAAVIGASNVTATVQLVTGEVAVSGLLFSSLNLLKPTNVLLKYTTALIQ